MCWQKDLLPDPNLIRSSSRWGTFASGLRSLAITTRQPLLDRPYKEIGVSAVAEVVRWGDGGCEVGRWGGGGWRL